MEITSNPTQEHWDKSIKEIMGEIDFDKIATACKAIEWKALTKDGWGYRDEQAYREQALRILKDVTESGEPYHLIRSGGFVAERRESVLFLHFALESWDTKYWFEEEMELQPDGTYIPIRLLDVED